MQSILHLLWPNSVGILPLIDLLKVLVLLCRFLSAKRPVERPKFFSAVRPCSSSPQKKIIRKNSWKTPTPKSRLHNTWPHSHYLMRLCNGVGGWVRLKYRLCRCRCDAKSTPCLRAGTTCPETRGKINDLMAKETDTPSSLSSMNLLTPLTPLLSWPLSGSRIRSVLFSYRALPRPPLPRDCSDASPRLLQCDQ